MLWFPDSFCRDNPFRIVRITGSRRRSQVKFHVSIPCVSPDKRSSDIPDASCGKVPTPFAGGQSGFLSDLIRRLVNGTVCTITRRLYPSTVEDAMVFHLPLTSGMQRSPAKERGSVSSQLY